MLNTLNLTPAPNTIFDELWAAIAGLFVPDVSDTTNPDLARFVKANQNFLPTVAGGNYVYMQPLNDDALNQQVRDYVYPAPSTDPVTVGTQTNTINVKQTWQLDCYGPQGDQWAAVIADAWRTMWMLDNWPASPRSITPLYADQPALLTVVNAEGQYESRWVVKLHGQVNRTVGLSQQFFTAVATLATPVDVTGVPDVPASS